jgi:hypothetical protein
MAGGPGTDGLGVVDCEGTGGLGIVGLAGPGLGPEEGLLGIPGCGMPGVGTWAAAVPATQRLARARVIPLFHVMICSSPESSGRSPLSGERGIDHATCRFRENDDKGS